MARAPLHEVIGTDILSQINEGILKPGDRLPSEQELSARFGVSRMTVRQALGRLEWDGLLTRKRGSGTFVAQTREPHRDTNRLGFHNEVGVDPDKVTTRELSREVIAADEDVVRALGIKQDQTVIRLVRLRYVDAAAVSLQESSIPYVLAPELARMPLVAGSLYRTLEQLGVPVGGAQQQVTALSADLEVASALGIAPGHPVIGITRTATTTGGEVIEFARSHTVPELPLRIAVGRVIDSTPPQ
ncbi:MAG: GntR family transcriptional regulator [Beutenbergiaceae bacterium]